MSPPTAVLLQLFDIPQQSIRKGDLKNGKPDAGGNRKISAGA